MALDPDEHAPCANCSDEHPVGVLEDGLCPTCCDDEDEAEPLHNADPDCQHDIVDAPGGGVKCTKCPGWFCY